MKPQLRRIVVAPNAFKGTLTAAKAASCIARGLQRKLPDVAISQVPLADGGDGTLDAIIQATGGRMFATHVHDPLGRRIKAQWGLTGDGRTAVIEMATASGLALLKPAERNPLYTCTCGTGELMRQALDHNISSILICIGGSATNDGGMGMARALGFRFLDQKGCDLKPGGGALLSLAHIDKRGLDPRWRKVRVKVACDVNNPLVGPHGAARVYGPQKGATPAMVRRLDAGLRRLADVIQQDLGCDVRQIPGAGAAGGMGGGLLAFLNARLRSGSDVVLDAVNLRRQLRGCDLVITGEGRVDGQTFSGKAPGHVAQLAKELGIPVILICGSLAKDAGDLKAHGIAGCFAALSRPASEARLKKQGAMLLEKCAARAGEALAQRPTSNKCETGLLPLHFTWTLDVGS